MAEFLRDRADREEVAIELSLESGPVRAGVKDLSVRGVGLTVENPGADLVRELEGLTELFIKIIAGGTMLVANARVAWKALLTAGSGERVEMGLEITMIAPEDSLALAGIIERIRKA
ncbi:MAG: hypothetical protein EPN93_19890 [Spirochaetes bacterium]|nr:MAG: hypothetical protein EPN93_19890 [Spirochaetota bacterium]